MAVKKLTDIRKVTSLPDSGLILATDVTDTTDGPKGSSVVIEKGDLGIVSETPATIKTKYESNADTNAFTDNDVTNLGNQSGVNSCDETALSIKAKYESNADTNVYNDADILTVSNQSGVNSGDETGSTIETKYESLPDTNKYTDLDKTTVSNQSGTNTGDQDLSGLLQKNVAITGATKTKITYDENGLVTSGDDATTNDIAESTDKNYQTDNQKLYNDATSSIQTQFDDIVTAPKTITITTSVSITSATLGDGGESQDGKNINIDNGSFAINIEINTPVTCTYISKGTGVITFTDGGGRTNDLADGVGTLDAKNSSAAVSPFGLDNTIFITNR